MSKARPFEVADCETDPFKYGRVPEPFIWGHYDGETYWEFENTADYVDFISQRRVILYAHNGGKFDWQLLSEYLEEWEPITIIAGRIASARIGECELRDSFNILPVRLADMEKQDFDYTKIEKDVRDIYMDETREYLKSDCVNLYKFVKEFRDNYGGNLTLASTAMKIWRGMGNETPKSDAEYYHQFKRFYYGGRVQCFEKGILKEPVKVHDINSAYPRAMMEKHPYGLDYIQEQYERDAAGFKFRDQGFYVVTAESVGAFPIVDELGYHFPDDGETREFSITGWEINTALRHGVRIDNVLESVVFIDEQDFAPYIDRFWAMKLAAEKDSPEYLFAKLFLNSLYGKFGANPEKYAEFMIAPGDVIPSASDDPDEWQFMDQLSATKNILTKPLGEEKQRFYNVATAASITGYVRAMLFDAIKSVGKPYYCDTDSVIFSGGHAMDMGKELGQWDYEGTFDVGAIAGKKLYAFRDSKKFAKNPSDKKATKTASKGVQLGFDDIMRVARGEKITYQKDAPTFSLGKNPRFIQREVKLT